MLAGAALPDVHAQQYPLRFYDQKDGLGNVAVTALVQDAAGHLWVGTENGLYRFDGTAFTRVTIEPGRLVIGVDSLLADAAGAVWMAVGGTRGGLYRWHGGVTQPVLTSDGQRVQATSGQALALLPDGRVLMVSQQRLLVAAPEAGGDRWSLRPFLDSAQLASDAPLRNIQSVYAEPDGTVWCRCDAFLCRMRGRRVDLLAAPWPRDDEHFLAMFRARAGSLWLRTSTRVWEMPAGTESFIDRSPDPQGEPVLRYFAFGEDRAGRVVARGRGGVVRWHGERWESVGPEHGLRASGGVTAYLMDSEGSVWLGTAGRGLVHWLGYGQLAAWTRSEGLRSDEVWSFARDGRGVLHLGTGEGVNLLDERRNRLLASDRGGPASRRDTWASMARDSGGNLWIGTFSGAVLRLDAASGRVERVATGPLVIHVLVDSDDRVWVSTAGGIFSIDARRDHRTAVPVPVEGVESSTRSWHAWRSCVRAEGDAWFITDLGVLRWDGRHLRRVALRAPPGARLPPGFGSMSCGRDGRLWLAGGGEDGSEVWRLKWTGNGEAMMERFVAPRLAGRLLMALHEDRRGWLWVATDRGVAVWNRQRWREIDQATGLVWNDCNQGALHEDVDGSLWVGTTGGASHITAVESLFADAPVAPVSIDALERGGRSLLGERQHTLAWSPEALKVRLTHPALNSGGGWSYRYRLVGLDEAWEATRAPQLQYPSLPPGRYRLEVAAYHDDVQSQSAVTRLEFEVLPPWWRTGAFYLLCAAMVITGSWLMVRWRMRLVVARHEQLEALVGMRTRELQASQEQLRELALKDALTGVWNRRAMMEALEAELARCRREARPLALVLVDADHFKRINDEHGHLAGDAVLREIAQRLQASTRSYDRVGRYGGEEFLLLLPGLDTRQDADRDRIAEFHRVIAAQPFVLPSGQLLSVTCSFGVAQATFDAGADSAQLIGRADQALYRAKQAGRNRVEHAV